VARLIGQINRLTDMDTCNLMVMGPGRWGTSSPDLGIPTHFAEIDRVRVLCEIVTMRENLIPDVSLGTHFLNELVEMNMLYLALFPKGEGNSLKESLILGAPNHLTRLVPGTEKWADMVRVVDTAQVLPQDARITLMADAVEQRVVAFLDKRSQGLEHQA
jgi:hypothetical protein